MKSDLELVQDLKNGDRKAFSELVQRHQRTLLRMIMRFTREQSLAEDIVQESFIKAYQKIDLFEARSSFKSWLFQIAMNTARNRFRERHQEVVEIEDRYMGVEAGAEMELVQGDIRRKIREEVDRLPEKQRIALTLRVFEDMSFKEIAQIMGCPYDTAKANYRHALLKLRERLEQDQTVEGWDVFIHQLDGTWDGAMVAESRSGTEVEQ